MSAVEWLVIGYGNELRSDDGVGPKAARLISEWRLPNVRVLVKHQLTPELVIPLSEVNHVVFIDASFQISSATLQAIIPSERTLSGTMHTGNADTLLALCQALYGHRPKAWQMLIPIADTRFGDCVSPMAQSALNQALSQLARLLSPEAPHS